MRLCERKTIDEKLVRLFRESEKYSESWGVWYKASEAEVRLKSVFESPAEYSYIEEQQGNSSGTSLFVQI